MTVDELQIVISASTDKLRQGIDGAKNQLNKLTNVADKTGNNLVKNIVKGNVATKVLIKTFQVLTSNVGDAVSRLDTLNNFPRVMENLGISGADAQKSIDYLSEKLNGLPTTLDDAASSVQRLTAANGNIQASTKMFLAMNNAILAGGGNMQIQKSALEQLSQAYSKGKPDMMEWRTMMTAMPAQLKQVGLAMGYASADELGQALRDGSVSMNDFMKTMMELNENGANGFKSFQEQAEGATGGVQTSITNMKTAITRGLANIMNAIGQSNIAGFFRNITNAINAATNYVVAFVKVMVTAVNYISKLFGGKGLKSTTTAVSDTSTAMSNLGNSGSSASKGMDKASGSAKKLKKELLGLAAFDEMNVLKEPDDSDSGSGGSGSSEGAGGVDLSGIDFGDLDTSLDTTGGKLDELYEKMLNTFKWFTEDMDFHPLVDSFHNLGDAIDYLVNGAGGLLKDFIANYLKPLLTYKINEDLPRFFNITADAIKGIDFGKVGDAFNKLWDALIRFDRSAMDVILWFYEEVIVPIGHIVINDILPGFLKLVAGAIDVLSAAIDGAKPVIEWLWENFLGPAVEWAGSAIGDALGAIGDALSWIADNEVACTTLQILVGIITALVAVIAIWNVVGAIAAGVTTALGVAVAILTSPITLVIAAIVAVIAVIVLLVKHWDDVKAAAEKVWNKIVEIWGVVADWFNKNVIEPIKQFFSPIIDFFSGIFQTAIDNVKIIFENLIQIASFVWDGIKLVFSVIGDWFKEKWDNTVKVIKTVFEPIKNFFSSIWDGIKNIFSKVGDFFKDVFKKAYTAVKNVFDPIVNFFSGIFDKVKNIFKNIATTVGNVVSGAFKGVINGILGTVERVLNAPINAVNGLIGTINKVPGINLSKLKTFNLPRMATGGIVDKPTYALVGENGKEAVMPLENNTGWMDMLADKISDNSGTKQPIIVKIGDETILNKIINGINKKSFETNGAVFDV